MFKDIKIFVGGKKIAYQSKMKNGKIECSIDVEDGTEQKLELVFDENVFENFEFDPIVSFQRTNIYKYSVDLENCSRHLTVKFEVNYKFFVKTVVKFMNGFIDIPNLLWELNIFNSSTIGQKYANELSDLIARIEEPELEEILLSGDKEMERIENILINDELYLKFAKSLRAKDLMLIITSYIAIPNPPKVSQNEFDELVEAAIDYEDSLENVWRLGMTYDSRGYDYSLLDSFFAGSRDTYYISEYISSIKQVEQKKIVDMVIKTEDKEFIRALLEDNFIQYHLDEKYKTDLKKALENL